MEASRRGGAAGWRKADGADTIRPRLHALGADLDRVFVEQADANDGHGPLRLPTDWLRLDHALTQTAARMLVIDPIMAFLDPRILAGSDQSVRQALYPLARIAHAHACAVLLVRHLDKRGGSRSLYRGGGSIAFLGACRSGWLIARDPQAPAQCVLAQVKNNLAPPQPSLAYHVQVREDGPPLLTWLGPHSATADQLLAGPPYQDLAEKATLPDLEPWLASLREQFPSPTPLDDL